MDPSQTLETRRTAGLQPSPYADTLGLRHDAGASSRGCAVFTLPLDERVHNINGVTHGGALAGLADSALGIGMVSLLAPGERCTNVDLSLKFLRATRTGTLRATSRVIKEGRTTCVLAADIVDDEGQLVATAESTFLRLVRDA